MLQERLQNGLPFGIQVVTAAADPAPAPWHCEAYGPDAAHLGALCFVGELLAGRCRSADRCREVMTAERERLFARIQELAAAGDPTGTWLAGQFTSPDQLLGGPAEDLRAAAELLEVVDVEEREDLEGIIAVAGVLTDPPVGLNCPYCGTRARMMASPTQALCFNFECPMLMWDPTLSAAEIAAAGINEPVLNAEREASCGCPRRGANIYHVAGECDDPTVIAWGLHARGSGDPE